LAAADRQRPARRSWAHSPFRSRRNAAEDLARDLAAALPAEAPLHLTLEQQQLAGPRLAKLLSARVAFITAASATRSAPVSSSPWPRRVSSGPSSRPWDSPPELIFHALRRDHDTRYMAGNFERQVQPDEIFRCLAAPAAGAR